jgi:hypothetical protein
VPPLQLDPSEQRQVKRACWHGVPQRGRPTLHSAGATGRQAISTAA